MLSLRKFFKVTLPLETRESEIVNAGHGEKIMQIFEKMKEISSADVIRALKVSKATAVSYLDDLVKAGEIVRVGRGPKTRYKPK